MRKFFPILMLAFVSLFTYSCDDNDDEVQYVDNDTYAGVLEITRSFQYNSAGAYNEQHVIRQAISQYGMLDSDKVLVYRLKYVDQGNDVWQQIPTKIYLSNGNEVDYDFDFTKNDVQIYVNGTYNVTTTPEYYNNQTFRLVLVPAGFLNKGTAPKVDYSDYNAVIKYYNIDDSKVVKIK
jgi:N-methylhydantoinase B/oxoprolinase/acetone carboxylase alpha subunit